MITSPVKTNKNDPVIISNNFYSDINQRICPVQGWRGREQGDHMETMLVGVDAGGEGGISQLAWLQSINQALIQELMHCWAFDPLF